MLFWRKMMMLCWCFQSCLKVCVCAVFYADSQEVSVWFCSSWLWVPLFVSTVAVKFFFTCGQKLEERKFDFTAQSTSAKCVFFLAHITQHSEETQAPGWGLLRNYPKFLLCSEFLCSPASSYIAKVVLPSSWGLRQTRCDIVLALNFSTGWIAKLRQVGNNNLKEVSGDGSSYCGCVGRAGLLSAVARCSLLILLPSLKYWSLLCGQYAELWLWGLSAFPFYTITALLSFGIRKWGLNIYWHMNVSLPRRVEDSVSVVRKVAVTLYSSYIIPAQWFQNFVEAQSMFLLVLWEICCLTPLIIRPWGCPCRKAVMPICVRPVIEVGKQVESYECTFFCVNGLKL